MKVVAKPIQMISWTDEKGQINPIRFRFTDTDEKLKVVKIDKVIEEHLEKLAGNPMKVFTCRSLVGNETKLFEIKYELATCKWILFKI